MQPHRDLLLSVRRRIAHEKDMYVCHALRSVVADAVISAPDVGTARWYVLAGMELYHSIQVALNSVPHLRDGERADTFTYARFCAAGRVVSSESFLSDRDRTDRLDWLDRSINGVPDVPGVVPRIQWL